MRAAAVPTAELRDAIGPVDGVEVEVWDGVTPPPPGLGFLVPDYRTTLQVLQRLGQLPDVQVVQTQVAGYDGLVELLPEGVVLCNAQGVHDDATAEHAVGLALAVLRRIPEAVRGHGSWQGLQTGMRSLADARVLILGYGSIGRAVAERLVPMKARVTAVATAERDDDLIGRVRSTGELPELLPDQDVVIVLVPLSERTRGLVGDDFLARLPDGAVVVNVARGGVVDTEAVIRHAPRLRFALDVTDPEPLPDGHPLWDAPDVLITPHVAGGTTAMLPRVAALVRSQLRRWVDGESLANVVSP
jgi:phosphoglycerate dehydrogenase-like enzyme